MNSRLIRLIFAGALALDYLPFPRWRKAIATGTAKAGHDKRKRGRRSRRRKIPISSQAREVITSYYSKRGKGLRQVSQKRNGTCHRPGKAAPAQRNFAARTREKTAALPG